MPQASPELRAEWESDLHAILYLLEQGYSMDSGWEWVTHGAWEITDKEWRAAQYLRDEWDYGLFAQHPILPLRFHPSTTTLSLIKSRLLEV